MAIKKKGMQSPWLQIALGSAANFSEDKKKEREQQAEYARKAALMDRERQEKMQDRSHEQELRTTARDEQRTYEKSQAEALRAQRLQDAQTAVDPTGIIRGAEAGVEYTTGAGGAPQVPSASGWSGTAGYSGDRPEMSTIQETAQGQLLEEISKIEDPTERMDRIEGYNPKNLENPSQQYLANIFYQALKPVREQTEKKLRSIEKTETTYSQVRGMIGPSATATQQEREKYYSTAMDLIAQLPQNAQTEALAKDVNTKAWSVPKKEKPAEAKEDPNDKARRNFIAKAYENGPLKIRGKVESVEEMKARIAIEADALSASLGMKGGNEGPVGVLQNQPANKSPFELAIAGEAGTSGRLPASGEEARKEKAIQQIAERTGKTKEEVLAEYGQGAPGVTAVSADTTATTLVPQPEALPPTPPPAPVETPDSTGMDPAMAATGATLYPNNKNNLPIGAADPAKLEAAVNQMLADSPTAAGDGTFDLMDSEDTPFTITVKNGKVQLGENATWQKVFDNFKKHGGESPDAGLEGSEDGSSGPTADQMKAIQAQQGTRGR